MSQLALLPSARPTGGDVSDEIVYRQATFHAALKLCMDVSGLNDQQIADQIDLDAAQMSRIKKGDMHFPPNKLMDLMDACGNEIPLRWLAMRRGYDLKQKLSAVELENHKLRAELAERQKELEIVKRFVRETR